MFAGKRYWIVGASEGLGRAIAEALDAQGARLVLSARNADRLAGLASTLKDAVGVAMDVGDPASVAAAHDQIGPVDGMIYCVGLYDPMSARDWDAGSALAMCDANFTGAVRVLGHVVPAMMAANVGHIVMIGSLAGFRALPAAIGYGASKAALMHLTENLAVDLRRTGIKVQLVNPGFIRTRLTAKNDFAMPQIQSPEAAADHVLRAMRSGRFQTSFPAPFAWLFRLAKFVPQWLYLRLLG